MLKLVVAFFCTLFRQMRVCPQLIFLENYAVPFFRLDEELSTVRGGRFIGWLVRWCIVCVCVSLIFLFQAPETAEVKSVFVGVSFGTPETAGPVFLFGVLCSVSFVWFSPTPRVP